MSINEQPAVDKVDKTIQEMLSAILSQEDLEAATLVADALNIYISAMRRRDGRIRIGPIDAHGILSIVSILLGVPTIEEDIGKLYGKKLNGGPSA